MKRPPTYSEVLGLRSGKIYLIWFRDQGNGQEAADAVKARQECDGVWPVAILEFMDNREAQYTWDVLWKTFRVNAVTNYIS